MNLKQYLEHHNIVTNPFSDEDAQTDLVFKSYCISHTYHPTWDKIYGNPAEPATAVVFGEKGSGKTAMKLQIAQHLEHYNLDHTDDQVFAVEYDDFNPFLDEFRDRFRFRRPKIEKILEQWKLWDHMDAILSLATTQLVDRILGSEKARYAAAVHTKSDTLRNPAKKLDQSQRRDLLLLAACYDRSTAQSGDDRWNRLCGKLRFYTWKSLWDFALPIVGLIVLIAVMWHWDHWDWLKCKWTYIGYGVLWLPRLWRCMKAWYRARKVRRNTRVINQNGKRLRKIFRRLTEKQLASQPLPTAQRTDDRYELLAKLQNILAMFGFPGVIVLVDRVDEPYLINGTANLMKSLLWPMLDNKLLKHPGVGIKLLLPEELCYFVDGEGREFHQRARLDKQNLVRSLAWTGESLYDVANARLAACAASGVDKKPTLDDLFDESITHQRMLEAFRSLRVPRHMFKFLYRVIVAHTNAHTESNPSWRISSADFESTLAVYLRDQDNFDRGTGAV